jgi:hypothetical protein
VNTHKSNFSRFIVVGSILAIGLIACGANQDEKHVTNPFSPLLKVLVKESDFTNDWDWIGSSLGQFPDAPSQENGQLAEWATSSLQGSYGKERYEMNFFHILHRYNRAVTLADIDNSTFPQDGKGETVDLALNSLGNQRSVKCIKLSHILECQVAGVYKNVVSIFRIWAPPDMQEELIVNILNPVLQKVDSRAKEMEGVK